ncbi:hypothetical protein PENTCL1PPCAC_14631, partial [Pristionchus entomophagus]
PVQPPMRNCLICSVQISECHLGVDCCLACSAFYKRTINLNKESLKCKMGTDDCTEFKAISSCRKCRFLKLCEVLEQSANPSKDQETDK